MKLRNQSCQLILGHYNVYSTCCYRDKLDKLVQLFGHDCLINWTRLSNCLSTFGELFVYVWLKQYILYMSCPINGFVQPVSLVQADE